MLSIFLKYKTFIVTFQLQVLYPTDSLLLDTRWQSTLQLSQLISSRNTQPPGVSTGNYQRKIVDTAVETNHSKSVNILVLWKYDLLEMHANIDTDTDMHTQVEYKIH